MKKNLKSANNDLFIRISLYFEKLLKEELWQYAVVLFFVGTYAYLSGKILEGIMFVIAHTFIRSSFAKQLHFDVICFCLTFTIFAFCLSISNTLPTSISLLSSIPVAIILCYIGFVIQDRLDLIVKIRMYESKTIWNMSECELRDYCKIKGIARERIDFVVYVVIHQYHFNEIADRLGYSLDTIKDWSGICKNKLNIKCWKPN